MKKEKGKREKNKKKGIFGKIFLTIMLLLMVGLGAYLGYSISHNGGGLQGVLATVLGQDMDKLENLDTINILLLRN